MNIDIERQIREFFTALGKKYSYDISQNSYIWFGVLWGIPIPIVTLLLEVHFHQLSGINHPLWAALHNPVQLFFLLHPLLFGAIFGILGTIRAEKDTDLAEYLYNDTLESITDRADQALYSAQNSGRKRVVAWSSMEK